MFLDVPKLDDRTFEELFREALALVPRYVPEWTDHNTSDPGVMLIELFAWIVEQETYRADLITDRIREAAAKLMGVSGRDPIPAELIVWPDRSLFSTAAVLPLGTRLVDADADRSRGSPIVFGTDRDVQVSASSIVRVVVRAGGKSTDRTAADAAEGAGYMAFGMAPEMGDALEMVIEPGLEQSELCLYADLIEDDLPPVPVVAEGEALPPAAVTLVWQARGASGWHDLDVMADETNDLDLSGRIILALPEAVRGGPQMRLRATIEAGAFEVEPQLRRLGLHVLRAEQTATHVDRCVGVGDGTPDQSFTLLTDEERHTEQLLTERIELVSGNGAKDDRPAWTRIDDLSTADPGERRFELDPVKSIVRFGNGVNGANPAAGEPVVARWFRTTRGAAGQVAAGLTWRVEGGIKVGVNPHASTAGRDRRTGRDLVADAGASRVQRFRAITIDDHISLALGTPGVRVARAVALANRDPRIPCAIVPGHTTVAVLPYARLDRPLDAARPRLLAAVRRRLEAGRLAGETIDVIGAGVVTIDVRCRLRYARGENPPAVHRAAEAAVRRLIAPIGPGGGEPGAWPFGRAVTAADVLARLDTVAGVEVADNLELMAGEQRGERIELQDTEVPQVGTVMFASEVFDT